MTTEKSPTATMISISVKPPDAHFHRLIREPERCEFLERDDERLIFGPIVGECLAEELADGCDRLAVFLDHHTCRCRTGVAARPAIGIHHHAHTVRVGDGSAETTRYAYTAASVVTGSATKSPIPNKRALTI
jgi:hypothetical protein